MLSLLERDQPRFGAIVQLNLPEMSRSRVVVLLKRLGERILWATEQAGNIYPTEVGLIGFSARFFKGQYTPLRDQIPHALRFGIQKPVPRCLLSMRVRFDERYAELNTGAKIGSKESDLYVLLEHHSPGTVRRLVERLSSMQDEIEVVAIHFGQTAKTGEPLLGVTDGISNLQWSRKHDWGTYSRWVYVQPEDEETDEYCGGTYLVFRKYRIDLERWWDDNLEIARGEKKYTGARAREHILGRASNDSVVENETGRCLPRLPDDSEVLRAPLDSHIRQANPRRVGYTNFGAEVSVPDFRILRRSWEFSEPYAARKDKMRRGLLFLCFQSNIQERGFEFIHDEWLMSKFCGARDSLLDPASGLVEPIAGCYYFIPRWTSYPGDVFFGG